MKKSRFFSQDKTSSAVLLFFLIILADLSAAVLGFGGAFFFAFITVDFMFSSCESLVVSACAVCFNLLMTLYAYRTIQPKKLKAIGFANLVMSLFPFVINSVYYPFTYLIADALSELAGISESFNFSDFRLFLSELVSVPLCGLCFILLLKLKKGDGEKHTYKLSFCCLSLITVLFFGFVSFVSLYVCNTPVSEEFNYSASEELVDLITESFQKDRTVKFFDSITGETDLSQADAILREDGFIPHTEIKEYIKDKEKLDIQLDNLKGLLSDDGITVYTKPVDGHISYLNDCIMLSASENGKVKWKKITYDVFSVEEDKTDKAKETFSVFRIGDDKKSVLKELKKVADISSYSVEYGKNTVKEVYDFNAVNDISFLHLIDITYFDATLIFENGILTDGNYTYTLETNADSDETEAFQEKYTIPE